MSKGINHNSNGKQKRLQKLVWSIRSKLEEVGNGSHQSEAIIQKIDDVNTNNTPAHQSAYIRNEHEDMLLATLAEATEPSILSIVRNIKACLGDLTWKEDRSEFYSAGSDVGKRYIESNLHTQLIGPGGSVAKSTVYAWCVYTRALDPLQGSQSHRA